MAAARRHSTRSSNATRRVSCATARAWSGRERLRTRLRMRSCPPGAPFAQAPDPRAARVAVHDRPPQGDRDAARSAPRIARASGIARRFRYTGRGGGPRGGRPPDTGGARRAAGGPAGCARRHRRPRSQRAPGRRQLGISECATRQLVFRARAALRAGTAACLVPPVFLLRVLRRIAPSRGRVTLLARAGASGNWPESGARLLKLGAMAAVGATAIGAGAYHLVTTPHGGAPSATAHGDGAHRRASVGGAIARDRRAPALRAGAATASGRSVHATVGTSTAPAVRASTLAGPNAFAPGATLAPTAASSADTSAAGSGAVAVGASVPVADGQLGGSPKTPSKVLGATVTTATKPVAGLGQTVGAVATQKLGEAAGAVNGVTATVGGAASTATQAAGQAVQGVASTATGVAGAASGVVASVGSAAAGAVSTSRRLSGRPGAPERSLGSGRRWGARRSQPTWAIADCSCESDGPPWTRMVPSAPVTSSDGVAVMPEVRAD